LRSWAWTGRVVQFEGERINGPGDDGIDLIFLVER
jgi:hypothetical protein